MKRSVYIYLVVRKFLELCIDQLFCISLSELREQPHILKTKVYDESEFLLFTLSVHVESITIPTMSDEIVSDLKAKVYTQQRVSIHQRFLFSSGRGIKKLRD